MNLSVLKYTGEEVGRSVQLPKEVFGIEPNDHAIYLDVKAILAGKRQGTHQAKERNAVSGSRRKIKRQKGRGTARAGDIKSPLFRGGGRIFGPRPRDYSFKLNRKVKKLARKSALTYKAKANHISILEPFSFEAPKTKSYLGMLQNLSFLDEKTLLIIPSVDKNIVLSSRNIKQAKVVCVDHVNTYDLLHAKKLLIMETAITPIVEKLTQ
ncbi:50S ribosomal protein L4 [Cardinium endosymbiont cEper1 of Encarsia pergandiella]|uniref:50S ribosomal protein L4 n=1 Tax=Cardinium endosymbiont of Encarsia pergandiella TaxID=249402 RepID=UPI00027EAAF5|nr:50S ribosomal protein L4 [Cardinium endosymbiont of Encarsia pergandiella]CCM09929.1 50S ribosomal protein L4 [Cardinium endosymbiont cEper1 of Encarsia pergandiella]